MPGTGFEYIQATTVLILILNVIGSAVWIKRNKNNWRMEIPSIVLYIHALIYYVVLFIDRGDLIWSIDRFTNWSAILRLQGYATMGLLGLFRTSEGLFVRIVLFCSRFVSWLQGKLKKPESM